MSNNIKRIISRGKSQHKGKPTAILSADWHVREDRPKCRVDDFGTTITRKVKFIKDMQKEYHNIPVLLAGDAFHRSKPRSQELQIGNNYFNLLTWSLQNFPDNIIAIAGQHDIPNHNLDLINQSNLSVLAAAGKITYGKYNPDNPDCIGNFIGLHYFPFGKKIRPISTVDNAFLYPINIAMIHELIYRRDIDYFPGIEEIGTNAIPLLKKYDYDLILSGDNHTPFVVEYENKLLVNPGSLYRSTAKQKEHKPRVYLWYAESNTVEPVFIPIDDLETIDIEYLEKEQKKENQIQKFAARLKDYDALDIDFLSNLDYYFKTARVHKKVKELVNEYVEL